jgi:phage-related protein
MPLTFPTVIKQEMTKQSNVNAFLILFEINIEGEIIRLCRNNSDINFAGNTYTKWAIELDPIKSDLSGQITLFNVIVDNTLRSVQNLVLQYPDITNSTVKIMVVNSGNLGTAIPDFDATYNIEDIEFSDNNAVFSLGVENILIKRVPYRAYNKNRCPYVYKGIECGSTSSYTTCGQTLSDCRLRNNSARFGGEINIPDLSGVYI